MSTTLNVPVIGRLQATVIESLEFKTHGLPLKAGPVNITINLGLGVPDDDSGKYIIGVEVIIKGTDKEKGNQTYSGACRVVGSYEAKEDLRKYGPSMFDYAKVRGLQQLYPLARLQLTEVLARSNLTIHLPFEPDLGSATVTEEQAKPSQPKKSKQGKKRAASD